MVFKKCPDDKHRCSRNSCTCVDDLGFVHVCKRRRKPLGFYSLRVPNRDSARRKGS
jgi:hypothetical protein